YGPTTQEVKAVSNFLSARNLTVVSVAENNLYVKAQGTIADIQKAFRVAIHQYRLNGQTFRSNTADPSVSGPVGAQIAAVTGLDDYGFEPKIARRSTAEGVADHFVPLTHGPNGFFFEAQCFRPVETDVFLGNATTATYTGNRYG